MNNQLTLIMNKKNLLIGAALGYNWTHVLFFIESFRKYNKTDDVALLVSELDEETKEKFNNWNVTPIMFNPATYSGSIACTRFIGYLLHLVQNDYDNVFLSDVRDVYFQNDPFASCPENPFLFFFKEDSKYKIGNDSLTRNWIIDYYGTEFMPAIAHNPIICSGTIMGDRISIINFLCIFFQEFSSLSDDKQKLFADQGIVNKIIHTRQLNSLPVTLKDNGDIVATLALTIDPRLPQRGSDIISIDISNNKLYLNDNIPSVVHQFDRLKTLVMHAQESIFGYSVYAT